MRLLSGIALSLMAAALFGLAFYANVEPVVIAGWRP